MAGYVVQYAQGTITAASGTVTLPGETRTGNTLIAMASVRNAGASNGTLSSVTLGGLPDNFAQAGSVPSASGPPQLYWWLDPLCAGGQTSVAFAVAGGSGSVAMAVDVLEAGGMFPLPAGPGAADVTAGSVSAAGSTVWGSGSVPAGWPCEIWCGIAAASGTHSATGAGYPWVGLASQPCGTVSITQAAWALTSYGGTVSYAGTFAASQPWTAGAMSFPCMPFSPDLPQFLAGTGPQQGDMYSLVTSPLGFGQQKVVFRAAQVSTTTTLPAGSPGTSTVIGFDTVYEDPWQGWDQAEHTWTPPLTGWYQITFMVATGEAAADTILSAGGPAGGLVIGASGGQVSVREYEFGIAGTPLEITAHITGTSPVTTSSEFPSTLEIVWAGFSAG